MGQPITFGSLKTSDDRKRDLHINKLASLADFHGNSRKQHMLPFTRLLWAANLLAHNSMGSQVSMKLMTKQVGI